MTVSAANFDPRQLLERLPDMVFVVLPDATLGWIGPATQDILGWTPDAWTGRSVMELVHPDDRGLVFSSIESVWGKARGTPVELRVRDSRDRWRLVEVIGASLDMALPGIPGNGVVCIARDLTDRRMWEIGGNDLVRVQRIMQHAASLVLLVDSAGIVASTNAAFGRLLGHDPSVVVGQPLAQFVVAAERAVFERALGDARRAGGATIEVHLRDSAGVSVPVRAEIAWLRDDPLLEGYVITGSDITELHSTRRELEYLARHDHLTGLVNRAELVRRLELYVAGSASRAALAFIDLDEFKPVNDTHGHEAGDQLLVQVARRLLDVVRPTDLVARVGGDEFVVLAPGLVEPGHQQEFAARLSGCFDAPFRLGSSALMLGASVGFVTTRDSNTVASALADADAAMYAHKARRRGGPDAGKRRRG